MTFVPGDRVRWLCEGDDGLPQVRYGFIGDEPMPTGEVQVVFDGELGGRYVWLGHLDPVSITSIVLSMHGSDLIEDPDLRRGLVGLWRAEAESAGLEVSGMLGLGTGVRESVTSWALAEVTSGGERYVVRAWETNGELPTVQVRAESPSVYHA